MRILLVDDHALFREGLKNLLHNQSDFSAVGEAGTVREAVEQCQRLKPELVLMAANLADVDAVEAVQQIRAVSAEIKVVLLTREASEELFLACIRNGAAGFLLKTISISNLIASLHALARGESLVPRQMESSLVREFQRLANSGYYGPIRLEHLTPRELQIFGLVGSDCSYGEIAADLDISINTVKVHVHNIYEKLDLRDHRALKRYAKNYIAD